MRLFYPSSEGFLMIHIQNMCRKAILICLNSNLGWVYDAMISSKTPFEGLHVHVAPISERVPDSYTI